MPVTVGVTCCVLAAGAGCGGGATSVSDDRPSRPPDDGGRNAYVEAAQELIGPPGRFASALERRADDPTGRPPAREELEAIVVDAERELREFRALGLRDRGVRRQRQRLAVAYRRVIAAMRPALDAVVAGDDPRGLRRESRAFFRALRDLPTAAKGTE